MLNPHDPFWKAVAIFLRYKRLLAAALAGAVVSAACFGSGLGMILPTLQLLLGQRQPLSGLIEKHLLDPTRPPWVQDLGTWLLAYVPTDAYLGFLTVMGVIALLTVVGSLGRYVHELLTLTVVARGIMTWRARLFEHVIRVRMDDVIRRGHADKTSRFVSDTTALGKGCISIMSLGVSKLFNGAAALAVAFWIDWRLTLIACVGAPVIALLLRKFGKKIRRASKRLMQQYGRMIATLTESLGSIRVVKVHQAEGYERRRFARINRGLFREELRLRQARALTGPIIETLGLFGVMAVASIAGWYIFRRNIPPEHFMTVLLALTAAAASLKPLSSLNNSFNEASAAATRMLEVLNAPVEPRPVEVASKLPALPRHRRDLAFERVTYTYPAAARPALRDVSLRARFGQTVAIVGSNGSGKTTLMSLLPRLLEPDTGRILIDGLDTARVTLPSLRRQIAMVTQLNILFQGTIAQNIAYGCQHEPMEKIVAAAKIAYADEFIGQLPNGYQTALGEAGEGLSGGQRQRLCIARAVLRNPAILILDEATSQIDADSEAKISQALRQIRHGRTTFIIAHRLSTVIDSDLIVVMADGQIIDQGTHAELLQRCQVYQTLTQTQLQPASPSTGQPPHPHPLTSAR